MMTKDEAFKAWDAAVSEAVELKERQKRELAAARAKVAEARDAFLEASKVEVS